MILFGLQLFHRRKSLGIILENPLLYKPMNKNDKMCNRFSDLPAYFCKSLSRGLPEQYYIKGSAMHINVFIYRFFTIYSFIFPAGNLGVSRILLEREAAR
jgi:hypothetical protein